MRLNERHGFASMPSRRRSRSVSRRSTTSNRSENFSQSLLPPLPAQRRRREDQDALDAAAEQQFGEDQPRLDGLAEPDVVGDEEADARHAQRLEQRHELVALDAHPAVEGARDRLPRRRSFAAGGVEVRGEGRPSCGAEERIEILRRHGAAGVGGFGRAFGSSR